MATTVIPAIAGTGVQWSLDSSGNPVGLYGPDGNLFMEFVDVGGSSASATVEV